MIAVEPLPRDDPEVAALDAEEANVKAAERAYRNDPALAADLEASGWFAERTQAAREGRAVASNDRRQAEPVLQFTPQPGQLQVRTTAWAGFGALLAEVRARRDRLVEQRRPQLLRRLADQEATLRARVLDTKVKDLGPLVDEANELLATATQVRGPIPRTVPFWDGDQVSLGPARYRERTDELELHDAATGGWSLLDPIDEPVSVVVDSHGIREGTSLPPAVPAGAGEVQRFGTHRATG